MKRKTMWAVTTGSSDYSVQVLFPTEEQAQEHAAALSDDEGDVTEFFVIEEGQPSQAIVWTARYNTYHGEDSEINTYSEIKWDYEWDFPRDKRPVLTVMPKTAPVAARGGWWCSAKSPDRKAAIKAVADCVAQHKAELAGIA